MRIARLRLPRPADRHRLPYAGIGIGPDGTAYLGVIGGIISLRDG